jgi:hypothetical protein
VRASIFEIPSIELFSCLTRTGMMSLALPPIHGGRRGGADDDEALNEVTHV